MKIASRVILLLALAALGFWLWMIFFPSPEKIIHKQLIKLAADISFAADENDLVKMADAQSVADFFSSNVVVRITLRDHEQQVIAGRDEITQAALASRQQATDLQVKFPDINITVAPDKKSATADVTVDATVSSQPHAVIQEMKITFEKVGGDWLIDEVETVSPVS